MFVRVITFEPLIQSACKDVSACKDDIVCFDDFAVHVVVMS